MLVMHQDHISKSGHWEHASYLKHF